MLSDAMYIAWSLLNRNERSQARCPVGSTRIKRSLIAYDH